MLRSVGGAAGTRGDLRSVDTLYRPTAVPPGTLNTTNIDNIHKIHAPKIQVLLVFQDFEALQAAATQTQRAGGA